MEKTDDLATLKSLLAPGKKTLVLFHASWCPDCISFSPIWKNYTKDNRHNFDKIIEAQIDKDENPIWDAFNVTVDPTVILLEGNKELRRFETKEKHIHMSDLNSL